MMRKYCIFLLIFILIFATKPFFTAASDIDKQLKQSLKNSKLQMQQMQIDDKLDKMNSQINNKIDDMNNRFRWQGESRALEQQSQVDNQNFGLQNQINAGKLNQNPNLTPNIYKETNLYPEQNQAIHAITTDIYKETSIRPEQEQNIHNAASNIYKEKNAQPAQQQITNKRLEQEGVSFVKTIIVRGTLRLSDKEIKDIIAPFQGQWLTERDIKKIINLLKSAQEKKGTVASRLNTSYKLKENKTLEIMFEEQPILR
jgi:hypothetical protein